MTTQRDLSTRFASGDPPELKFAIANGAAANTPIAVAGLTADDVILFAMELQPPTAGAGSAIVADRRSVASVPSAGNIQFTASTAGNQLFIGYYDVE